MSEEIPFSPHQEIRSQHTKNARRGSAQTDHGTRLLYLF